MTAPLPKERQLQSLVVAMLRFYAIPNLIWHSVPNEGERPPEQTAFLKRMGLLPGVADLVIVRPGGVVAYLELKTAKGRLTAEQRAFRDLCDRNGAPYAVVRTPEEAADILHEWGALRENPLWRRRAA